MRNYFEEVKNRSTLTVLSSIILFAVLYTNKETLLFVYLKPYFMLHNSTLYCHFITTNVTEIFNSYIKTILHLNLIITLFLVIFHCIIFVKPGLYSSEIKKINCMQKFFIKACLGYSFLCYNIIFPQFWEFFTFNWADRTELKWTVYFEPKLAEYIIIFTKFLNYNIVVSFITVFFVVYLNNKKAVKKTIKKKRKIMIFFIFIFTACITPPDVISQIYLGVGGIIILETTIFSTVYNNQRLIRQPIKTYKQRS